MFPKRLRQMTRYTAIRTLHLWLAVSLGGLFVVSGLTGSLLVFDHAIDEALNPDLLVLEAPIAAESRLSYDALLDKAKAHLGDEYNILLVAAPRHAASTQQVWMRRADGTDDRPHELYLHPQTGEVLGQRIWGAYPASFVYLFHYTLMGGKTGKLVLGYCAIGIMVLLVTGLYIWWPRGRGWHQWKAALTIKPNAGTLRRLFDLHRVAGVYGLLVLVVVVFSGIYMIFKDAFHAAAPAVTAPLKMTLREGAENSDMTVAEAIQLAKAALPESEISRIYTGEGGRDWLLTFATAEDPKADHGYNRLTIDPTRKEISGQRRWQDAPAGDRFFGWMFPLHNGEAFGLGGRIIVCLAGLLPSILMVTGIWRWQRKKRNAAHPSRGRKV